MERKNQTVKAAIQRFLSEKITQEVANQINSSNPPVQVVAGETNRVALERLSAYYRSQGLA